MPVLKNLPVLLLCSLLLAGCGEEQGNRYFPLEAGHYWQYDMTYETMDGRFKGVYAVENLGQQEINGEKLYVRQLLDKSYNYIRVNDEGVLLKSREKTEDLETRHQEIGRYILRYPLKAGTKWQENVISKALIKTGPPQKTEFHISTRVPVDITIESMTDTVEVPAGTFENCMRVTYSGSSFTDAGNYVGKTVVRVEETSWYAPEVGLVKSVRKESTKHRALDKGSVMLELREFR